MDKLAFGLTMMIVGIGGTFLTLTILIWSIELLKKLFPLEPPQPEAVGQIFLLKRLPPQWREKIPVETMRVQWSQGLTSMQLSGVTWVQQIPIDRLRTAWLQKLPVERLQRHLSRTCQTLRLEQITSRENRRATFSSIQARLFGRSSPRSPADRAPTDERRDQTRPS